MAAPILPPASKHWNHESNIVLDEEVAYQKRFNDPDTGIEPLRLTSLPYVNSHIYPEVPVSTHDGKRFIFWRLNPFANERTYWIADIPTMRVRQVTDEPDAAAPIVAPDGKCFYYSAGRKIMRMDLESFERQEILTIDPALGVVGGVRTISACGTRVVVTSQRPGKMPAVAAVELTTGKSWIVFEHPCARNAHQQYNNNHDRKVMIQINDGVEYDADGNLTRLVGENGASLHVINDDGSDHHILPIGQSPLEHVQGHECWLGEENVVISTTHRRQRSDEAWRQNRIVAAGPGDKQYRIICQGNEEGFTHIHTTRDGRYFIADCNRTAKIYIGSIRTGRYRLFCSSGSTFGSYQAAHPHCFFLAGDRTVGWNSDRTGIPHVYVAHIPAGFLDDLD